MANETKQAAKSAEQPGEIDQLRSELADMRGLVSTLLRAQGQVSPDSLWAKEQLKEEKNKNLLDEVAAYNGETNVRRSQMEANKMFPEGKKLFRTRLGVGGAGDAPELIIRCDDERDVKGRYQLICGITQIRKEDKHPEWSTWTIVDVTNDPTAQQAAQDKFVFQQAAA